MSHMFSIALIPIMLLVIAIPVLIGMAVYKDAKGRHMEPLLWALVSALVPYFIGLIVYLIVRASHKRLECATCGEGVEAGYSLCPHCGSPLKYKCHSCAAPVETGWAVCANCGAALPQGRSPLIRPSGGDSGSKPLWIALGVVAGLIMLFMAALLIGSFTAMTTAAVSSATRILP